MATFREAYIAGEAEVSALFEHPLSAINTLVPSAAPWDSSLVHAIRAFNARYDHHPTFNGDEAVIITGQQPAIFGGPLYSVYKAITTIKLAESLSAQHGVPVVPVFWVGSEDHDFDEAATIYCPTNLHTVRKLSLDSLSHHDDKALHEVELSEQIHDLIDSMAESMDTTTFKDEIQSFLHDSARNADSLSDWSTQLLVKLFRDTQLVFFAPHLAEARTVSSPIIQQAIENPLAVSQCVNDGAKALQELGYTAQVEKSPDECAFFLEVSGKRRKVTWKDNQFMLPELNQPYTESALLDLLHKTPEAFSPNVALRCVVQQHLFPVTAYVAGPGELSYWAQFRSVFSTYDLPMPVVYPRAEAVLTTTKLKQLLGRYDLGLQELSRNEDELVDAALRTITENQALGNTTSMRGSLNTLLKEWTGQLEVDSPTPASMASNLTSEINRKLDRLERVILHIDTEQAETVKRHIKRLRTQLAPNKKPQERVYSIYSYLFIHGWGLMDRLVSEIQIDNFELNEVEL